MDKGVEKIVFYDNQCSFCQNVVAFLKSKANKTIFFSPIQGKTAKELLPKLLPDYEKLNTLIYAKKKSGEWTVELYGKGALSALKDIYGNYSIYSAMYPLPKCVLNGIYKLIARLRSRVSKHLKETISKDQELP